jgi:hypothetical protein
VAERVSDGETDAAVADVEGEDAAGSGHWRTVYGPAKSTDRMPEVNTRMRSR